MSHRSTTGQTAAVMADTHNLSTQCDWLSRENRTELNSCLFLTLLPWDQLVPVLFSLFMLLLLFSLLINGLTLLGLGHSEDLSWEPRVAFFKNLVLSDVVQTVSFAPAVMHNLLQRRTMEFGAWCWVQYFVGTTCIFSSLATITCMALERYIYVCHAIHYLVILTRTRLRVALGLIWVYSLSVSVTLVVLLQGGTPSATQSLTSGLLCEPDTMEQHMGFPRAPAVLRKVTGPLTVLACLLVHAFSYLQMYRYAQKATIPFNTANTAARRTVLFYCGMLLLQLLPLLLKSASDALWELEGTKAMVEKQSGATWDRPAIAAVMHVSLVVLLLVPPCINPLVYGVRNMEMRQALLRSLRWVIQRGG